jgi:hypothetical protein
MKTFVYIEGFNLYYQALKNNGLGMRKIIEQIAKALVNGG